MTAAAPVAGVGTRGNLRAARGTGVARALLARVGRTVLAVAVSGAVIVGLWYAFIAIFNLNAFVARKPTAVWEYLFSGSDAGAHRSLIMKGVNQTLADAGVGYVAGTAVALAVAISFVLSRGIERSLMPVAMMLRSVPLVALTPLLTLIFGRDILAVTVISGIVVFFPSLVNLVFGLRSAPRAATDLVAAYGGGSFTTLRKVQLPSALPAFFAAARIAVPGALVGALLAEWLATGKGAGYLMLQARSTSDYDVIWASVVVVTVASVAIYALVGFVEAVVLARYGPDPARR